MECKQKQNLKSCTCTFECDRRGVCCRCVAYHRARMELPGCYFSKAAEKTGDRSIKTYISLNSKK